MHDARMDAQKALFENHLEFFATQRGAVTRRDGFVLVDSTSPDFTCAFVEDATSLEKLPARFGAVRLVPWSRVAKEALAAGGFESRGAITYMILPGQLPESSAPDGLGIEVVTSAARMDVFTDVQTRSFLEEGDSFEWWYAWLREKNHSCLGRDLSRFYVASLAGEPVGVTILVRQAKTAGIYGVATLPAHRKKGVSTALLARAVEDGRRGAEVLTLQVKTGSYAESLYEKLGFTAAFATPMFARLST